MSRRRRSRALNPTDGPEVAPRGAAVALRVVAHVSDPDPLGVLAGALAGRVDLRPEGVVVEVVVPREPRQAVFRRRPEHPARQRAAGERAGDAAERLDAD